MHIKFIPEYKDEFVELLIKNGAAYRAEGLAIIHWQHRPEEYMFEILYSETTNDEVIDSVIKAIRYRQARCSEMLMLLDEYRKLQRKGAIEHVVDVARRLKAEISGTGEISTRDDASPCAVDGVINGDPDDRSKQVQELAERLISLVGKQPEDLPGSFISKDVRTDTSRPADGRQVT